MPDSQLTHMGVQVPQMVQAAISQAAAPVQPVAASQAVVLAGSPAIVKSPAAGSSAAAVSTSASGEVGVPTEVGRAASFLGRGLVDVLVLLLAVVLLGLLLYLVVAAISFQIPLARTWLESLGGRLSLPAVAAALYAVGLITKRPTWAGGE
jgi:hypothetical protein